MLAEVARAVSLFLAVAFGAAMWHKMLLLGVGRAADHPMLSRPRLRRHAVVFLSAAVVVEGGMVVGLLLLPRAGLAASAGLLAVYAVAVARLAPATGCGCFGETWESGSREGAVRRNVFGAAASALCCGAVGAGTAVHTRGGALAIAAVAVSWRGIWRRGRYHLGRRSTTGGRRGERDSSMGGAGLYRRLCRGTDAPARPVPGPRAPADGPRPRPGARPPRAGGAPEPGRTLRAPRRPPRCFTRCRGGRR